MLQHSVSQQLWVFDSLFVHFCLLQKPVALQDEIVMNDLAADGEGIELDMLSKQNHSTAEVSYQAPEYVPAKAQTQD